MESAIVTRRASFSLYLAASGPGEAAKRVRQKIRSKQIEELRRPWGKLISRETKRETVLAFLGHPDYCKRSMIGYRLAINPIHTTYLTFAPMDRSVKVAFDVTGVRLSRQRHLRPMSIANNLLGRVRQCPSYAFGWANQLNVTVGGP
jgi:hypothetical protein